MGKCTICGSETDKIGAVYEKSGEEYEKKEYYICLDCVRDGLTCNKHTLIFYFALQLLWLNVIQRGLFSVVGIACALLCSTALIRLILILLRTYLLQKGKRVDNCLLSSQRYDEEASRLLVAHLDTEAKKQGKRLLTTYAYTRRYH